MVSSPKGALVAWHEPEPELSEAMVHSVVAPVVKITEPVGVPLPS